MRATRKSALKSVCAEKVLCREKGFEPWKSDFVS